MERYPSGEGTSVLRKQAGETVQGFESPSLRHTDTPQGEKRGPGREKMA